MPFCRRKCPYCDFYKLIPKRAQREEYVHLLIQEIQTAAERYRWIEPPVKTVYLGGGTPSLHPPSEIAELISKVNELWGITPGAEVTLEANPGTVKPESLRELKSAGINRLSLGIQSFSDRKLQVLFRDHTACESRECIEQAREAGFGNLSLDLIFGTPGETLEEFACDISELISNKPEHISLYNLEYHNRTVFGKWKKEGRITPLSEDLEADMYLSAHERLTEADCEHYEISNFALPGFRAVHNSAYWTGAPYLGLGPSAHSFDGKSTRIWNIADLKRYTELVRQGALPVEGQETVERQGRIEEWITLRLRRVEGIERADADRMLGAGGADELWERAAKLPGNLIKLDEGRFCLTAGGWFRENSVLGWLMERIESVD